MNIEQVMELMGAATTENEAEAMIDIAREHGITDIGGLEDLPEKTFFRMVGDAVERTRKTG